MQNHGINTQVDRWAHGAPFNHLPFGGFHSGGAFFAMGDSSVSFQSDSGRPATAMIDPDGSFTLAVFGEGE